MTILLSNDQCIAVSCKYENSIIFLVVVYANTYHVRRRSLCADLKNLLATYRGPWFFIGGFNSIGSA